MATQKENAKHTVDTVNEKMDEKVEKNVKKEKALDKDDIIEVISLVPNVSYEDIFALQMRYILTQFGWDMI